MSAVQITFLGMARSEAVESNVQRWVSKLDKAFGRVQRCTTWIEQPHHHARKGNEFTVRIELALPHKTLVVDDSDENVYTAIANGFRAARRQLQDHARILREHRPLPQA
jgi:ribosome-associated translation inhibitor RaiA